MREPFAETPYFVGHGVCQTHVVYRVKRNIDQNCKKRQISTQRRQYWSGTECARSAFSLEKASQRLNLVN